MNRFDLQWWAGAIGGAAIALAGAIVGVHPWDMRVAGIGAALVAFSLYRITPPGSVKGS